MDFMTDLDQLASLEGQQYLVLRPRRAIASLFSATQRTTLAWLPPATPHPNVGHVTLRGFGEPHRVAELRDAVREWAASQRPLEIAAEALDTFPPPFQIAILRLSRSESLVDGYRALTERLDVTDFARLGELPLDQWVFHMSLAYCSALSVDQWAELIDRVGAGELPAARETVDELEFVWYQGGEHREVYPLGG